MGNAHLVQDSRRTEASKVSTRYAEPKTAEPLKKPESPKSEISVDPQIEAEVLKRLKRETVAFRAAIDGLHETIAERNAAIHEQNAIAC